MKRHVSGRPYGVRTRPLSLILADAKSSLLGRFFLLPTKALLLWEPYGSAFRNPRRVGTWSFCSLFLTEKLHIFDQCLLLPTKAELLREPYEVRKWLSQNANAVRFVGKRRRRRPKRRFFAGKPSNCAGRRRRVKAQSCRLNRATTQGRPYGSVFRNPRRVGTWSFCSLFLTEKLHIFDQCLLLPTKAELLREPYEVRKWLSQNANAVRFVGKRRRRRPKRRFFAGKPSNCAGRRRRVKRHACAFPILGDLCNRIIRYRLKHIQSVDCRFHHCLKT